MCVLGSKDGPHLQAQLEDGPGWAHGLEVVWLVGVSHKGGCAGLGQARALEGNIMDRWRSVGVSRAS